MHMNYKTIRAQNKPTFPGSLFHVPRPTRGIFRPVLMTAKSLILILCVFREKTQKLFEQRSWQIQSLVEKEQEDFKSLLAVPVKQFSL